jgi:hypothetical protein
MTKLLLAREINVATTAGLPISVGDVRDPDVATVRSLIVREPLPELGLGQLNKLLDKVVVGVISVHSSSKT